MLCVLSPIFIKQFYLKSGCLYIFNELCVGSGFLNDLKQSSFKKPNTNCKCRGTFYNNKDD